MSPEEGCCSQHTDVNLIWISGPDNHLQHRAFLGFYCCLLSVCPRIPRRQSHILCVFGRHSEAAEQKSKNGWWRENQWDGIQKTRFLCHYNVGVCGSVCPWHTDYVILSAFLLVKYFKFTTWKVVVSRALFSLSGESCHLQTHHWCSSEYSCRIQFRTRGEKSQRDFKPAL